MIIPARGKVLVEIYSQKHPLIHLPETVTWPKLSVAEVIINNNRFNKGQLVLVPTKAGLVIRQGNVKYRLINELDIVAELSNDR
jgi:hypothetical protein